MIQKQFMVVGIFGLILTSAFGATTVIQDGLYVLETSSDGENLTVKATVQTKGYIGFGISPNGTMAGADIIISGFNSTSGEPYIGDYYATFNTQPILDTLQDVELISASENTTHTTVHYRRPLNSSGDQDLSVENRTQTIIWSIGQMDSLTYHGPQARGMIKINLIDG